MITEQQRQALLAELNGSDFGDIKAKPDPEQALIDAIQQMTKAVRVLAAATLYAVPTAPATQLIRPQPTAPKPMGQGIRRKPLL